MFTAKEHFGFVKSNVKLFKNKKLNCELGIGLTGWEAAVTLGGRTWTFKLSGFLKRKVSIFEGGNLKGTLEQVKKTPFNQNAVLDFNGTKLFLNFDRGVWLNSKGDVVISWKYDTEIIYDCPDDIDGLDSRLVILAGIYYNFSVN